MGERLLLILLGGIAGLIIGLFGPGIFPVLQDAQQAQQTFLQPPVRFPTATPFSLVVVRPLAAQTTTLPTLTSPTPEPTATPEPPEPTPVRRSFVIPLKGGGEMTVNASDHAAAINNVKSSGAEPAD